MSEENKNLGDDLKKGAEDAMDNAKEATKNIGDKAEDFAEEAKETASEFVDEVKETFASNSGENKKVLAGILGILFGGLGIHKFILGYQKEGFILLGITLISIPMFCIVVGAFTIYIPAIIGLIEGIIYLTKSDEEFFQTYQAGKKPWF
ncbi:NINE protein [Aquimarina sp. RZ0]|uniref:NINE protein n=1 Tax=Aquimarina sp. RZ0 TaxID=2607730 RepID=UPI0011F19184|nr:NINE protein [Aquimarina sp. RZ0]KAA1247737.1 NINE protein [Aquimarina sp. RZ0]